MPQFEYSGRDYSGSLVSGYVDAGSAADVAEKLFGDRVTPIEIRESAGKPAKKGKSASRSRMDLGPDATAIEKANAFLGFDKIEIDELIMFSRQMYSLTKAGLPLDRAIKGLEASMSNRKFRRILRDVITGLENGNTLATALGQHPDVFSQLFLSLVHVGENTGRLDQAFIEVSKYLELEKDTRKQVKSATRYPIFVMVAMAVALAVITVFVIPVFSETFERLGAELPWQTIWLMNTSDFVLNYWPFMIIAIVSIFFGFRYWVRTERGELRWDRQKMQFPLAGPVFEKIALARFARTFAMVMGAGLPIVQGLTVVAGAVGNAFVAHNVHKMREGVERGESLHRTAVATNMFSPLVLQMVAVGEETGNVDELLGEVADFYTVEVNYDIKRLSDAIEPVLISFIAVLVLILALGVFLPIWDLNTAVRN